MDEKVCRDGGRSGRARGSRSRGRRGRGARGRLHSEGQVVPSNQEGLPPVRSPRTREGRPRGRGRTLVPRNAEPVASTSAAIGAVVDISMWSYGTPLERPLHPKKARRWDPPESAVSDALPFQMDEHGVWQVCPSGTAPAPDEAPVPAEAPAPTVAAPAPAAVAAPADAESCAVPSPMLLLEFGGKPPITPSGSSNLSRRSQSPPTDEEIEDDVGFIGSEDDEDCSDDNDEDMVRCHFPREVQTWISMIEDDEDVADTPATPESAVASGVAAATASTAAAISTDLSLFDFEWKPFPTVPISPKSRRENFSNSNVGPTALYEDPYDTFVAIWDAQIMEHIATETNRYAQDLALKMFNEHTLCPQSRIAKWKDTTTDELYIYFAILLTMGVVMKSDLTEYWSASDDIFATPGFRAYMSLRRFELLNRCLHFANNGDMNEQDRRSVSKAKLFKINPIIIHLNDKFQSMYNLNQNIALDESLLQWKGWLSINQYIRSKVATVGIKSYEICESQTGYLWRFEIHCNREEGPTSNTDPLHKFASAIVLKLINGLEYKGHTLWMDSYYNSPALARRLKCLGLDCVGTMSTKQQYVPRELTDLTTTNMTVGQAAGATSGDVDLVVWRDLHRVAMISTYHGNDTAPSEGRSEPIVVHDYNVMMGGVDKKNRKIASHPIERKRARVWYKKLFRRLLNVSVLNSYILAKQHTPTLRHRSFRLKLIQSIAHKHSPALVSIPTVSQGHFFENHYFAEYPLLQRRQRKACSVCKKKTTYYCVGCNKPVCVVHCFRDMHL